ncbi:MAG: hypothetical protein HFJ59_02725 [Clostridia bacterium]|nr:hypothetical protein [Clostridia bacterium]
MKKRDKNKLPEVQRNGLKAKIRKAIFILLSSMRIATVSADTTKGDVVEEQEYTIMNEEKRDQFAESLKIITENVSEKINEKIIDDIIEKRR